MLVDDYRELKIDSPRRTERFAACCVLLEKFVDDFLVHKPDALQFKDRSASGGKDSLPMPRITITSNERAGGGFGGSRFRIT
jgi:hypothetical protein